jgi:hypothetical protein
MAPFYSSILQFDSRDTKGETALFWIFFMELSSNISNITILNVYSILIAWEGVCCETCPSYLAFL